VDDSDVTIGKQWPVNAATRLLLSVGQDEEGRAVVEASLVVTGVTFTAEEISDPSFWSKYGSGRGLS
jgi:hypothetical protein